MHAMNIICGDVTYNNNMFPQQNILFGYMDENGNPISSLGDKVKVNGTIRYPVNKDVYTKCFNDNDTRKRSTLQAAYEKRKMELYLFMGCIRQVFGYIA